MASDSSNIVQAFTAIQAELRKLPRPEESRSIKSLARWAGKIFGCRLLHWNPELENFRVEVIVQGQPASLSVYGPLDRRWGGRPHVFFEKLYKAKYTAPGQSEAGPSPERQFGITYSDNRPKRELKPLLDAFKECATEAGTLVASVQERLASQLPAQTLAAKQDLHRWIFTVYDIAWRQPSGSPLRATRYIPVQGLDAGMQTDESILYDLEHLRATPWSAVERRLDPNGWGSVVNFKEPYASWNVELPEYYGSRIDNIVQSSDWAIDWLVKHLEGR